MSCTQVAFGMELNRSNCQGRGLSGAKRINEKFQPQPELGHQVSQELEDGDGGHGASRGGGAEGDFQ